MGVYLSCSGILHKNMVIKNIQMHTFDSVPEVFWVSLASISQLPPCMACRIQPRNVDLELNDL